MGTSRPHCDIEKKPKYLNYDDDDDDDVFMIEYLKDGFIHEIDLKSPC